MELISIIIGLAGFLFGVYAYYKNRESSELTVVYSNELIEGKQKPGVEMLYLGEPVSDFIRYEITLFNSGRGELRTADFEKGVAVAFDKLQVVSHSPIFSSEGVNTEYQVSDQSVSINFGRLKRNNHMTFEVLTGAHNSDLNPPIINAELIRGKPLKLHQQRFEKEQGDEKYQVLVKYLGVVGLSAFVGTLLLIISVYGKYKALFVEQKIGLREQLNILLSVDSLLWFAVFLVSMVLLIFAYQSLKFLSPKFRRYKFEQLIQNKH